jgi:hypothetical protein
MSRAIMNELKGVSMQIHLRMWLLLQRRIRLASFISGKIHANSAFSMPRSSRARLVTLRHNTVYSVHNIRFVPHSASSNRASKLISASFEIAERDRPSPIGGPARSSAYSSIRVLRNTSVSSVWKITMYVSHVANRRKTACTAVRTQIASGRSFSSQ